MSTVTTVTGPISSDDLGRTLIHEHVFVVGEEYRLNYQDDWDEERKIDEAVRVADLYNLDKRGLILEIAETLGEATR